jgi:hypothetical protein
MMREMLFRKLLLIYQMPKTGSQSIEATLRECGLPHVILRFHYLSPAIALTIKQRLWANQGSESWKKDARYQLALRKRAVNAIRARKLLTVLGFKVPKVEVITSVREPIGLALSSTFENYTLFFPDVESVSLEGCRKVVANPNTVKYIQEWFDLELIPMLGIDVYGAPFPHGKGYTILENRYARVLVHRFEALSAMPQMLNEFLGCKVREVVNRNIGDAKHYAEKYDNARKNLRLPADFVRAQYSSKMMRHFYTDEERERFHVRWAEPACD